MTGKEYIQTKQSLWAKNKGIELVGSTTDPDSGDSKGFPAYTKILDDNLYGPISKQVKEEIESGDGGEFNKGDNGTTLPKIQAVHSSSAIGVNFFQYWREKKDIVPIAHACGLCSKENAHLSDIRFERKFPIDKSFSHPPNVDVVIETVSGSPIELYAIECKYSEAYGSYAHSGLREKYLGAQLEHLWKGFPNLRHLAESISPDDSSFHYLHPAQLIKHLLGLQAKFKGNKFKLLYLWYDVPDEDGCKHRKEIENFSAYTKADNVTFIHTSYQEVIHNLFKNHYKGNEDYINYLASRYL
jgi:hypothetical protein